MKMSHITSRICSKCKTEKHISEYYQVARGNTKWCKECLRELSKQRVADGRDKESKRKYQDKQKLSKPPRPAKVPNSPKAKKGKYERIKLTPIELIASNAYDNIKKRALYLNRERDVDLEWVKESIKEFCKTHYYSCEPKHPFKPSVDRLDNNKGYTKDNIKIVWLIENYCKNSFTDDDVIEFCKRKLGLL